MKWTDVMSSTIGTIIGLLLLVAMGGGYLKWASD